MKDAKYMNLETKNSKHGGFPNETNYKWKNV